MRLSMSLPRCPYPVTPAECSISAAEFAGEFHVGRGPDVDWTLPDPERVLSKRHFMLRLRDGAWHIADTSTNGTWLNAEPAPIGRAATRILTDGDRLRMGPYEIAIHIAATSQLPISAEPPRRAPPPDRPALPVQPLWPGEDHTRLPLPIATIPPNALEQPVSPQEETVPPRRDPPAFAPAGSAAPPRSQPRPTGSPQHAANPPVHPQVQPAAHPPGGPQARSTGFDQTLPSPYIAAPRAAPEGFGLAPVVRQRAARLPELIEPAPRPSNAAPPLDPPAAPPLAALSGTSAPALSAPALSHPALSHPALIDAFFAGAGLAGVTQTDPTAMMHGLGEAFRAMIEGLRAVLIARAAIKSEFRIEQTMIRATGNNPLKFSANDDDALIAILGIGRRASMTPAIAIEDALHDIRGHEIAVMAAIQVAVRAMLEQLSPDKLRALADQGGRTLLPAQRKARAWDLFEARHTAMVQDLTNDFDRVFGRAFANAYERALDEISQRETR